jgi:two-component system, LytTR family, response regulator
MKIRSVIVDDDAFVRVELKGVIDEFLSTDVEIIADFDQPQTALPFITREKPDLLFLDIQMPGMNGFEMLDHLDTSVFEVIFVTSFNHYAIQAIRYSALDYLLKPVDRYELVQSVTRYRQRTEKILTHARLDNLKHNMQVGNEQDFQLILSTKQGEYQFRAQDIVRCEADSNYTLIHLVANRRFLASKTLGDIEHMLSGERFLRIHKSHLVNASHISHLTAHDELMMSDNIRLPVSRRRLPTVRSMVRAMN